MSDAMEISPKHPRPQAATATHGQVFARLHDPAIVIMGVCLGVYGSPSRAIDTEPGAYTALPGGKSALGIYLQQVERNAFYVNGRKLPGRQELDSTAIQMVYRHYLQYGAHLVAPTLIANCSHLSAGGDLSAQGSASGCGDPLVGATLWLVNDPASRRYFGVSPYIAVPIGNYDSNSALNTGENRWKAGINSGYIWPLSESLLLDMVGDILWHGKNGQYLANGGTLEQGVIYNVQFHLRYQIDKFTRLSASYLHDWGGESSINGISQHNRKNQGRFRIGGAKFFDPNNQLQLEIGADTEVENGFKEKRRIILRYVRVF